MRLNNREVTNVVVEDIFSFDYPDFSDAYIAQAEWDDSGEELTDQECQEIQEQNPDAFFEICMEHYIA